MGFDVQPLALVIRLNRRMAMDQHLGVLKLIRIQRPDDNAAECLNEFRVAADSVDHTGVGGPGLPFLARLLGPANGRAQQAPAMHMDDVAYLKQRYVLPAQGGH